MRQHCKDGLLDVIMLDMMKCQINNSNWPYFGPVMMTGENVLVCACEEIVISETLAAYAWIMNSICYMLGLAPRFARAVTWPVVRARGAGSPTDRSTQQIFL